MRNFKKVLALVVVFAMALSFAVTASAVTVFPDVDSTDEYADAISMLKSLQVLGGDDVGNFNPEATITRAEFSKVLFVLMNGTPEADLYVGPSVFTDVAEDYWANGYINWASNLNIVNGKGDNKFAPKDPVTTHEAVKMFIVALTGKSTLAWPYGFVSEASKTNIDLFEDATVTEMAKPAVRKLIAQLCANAIFATDVPTFYEYNDKGEITKRPSAAVKVFNLATLETIVLDTSYDTWAASTISLIDQVSVLNAAGTGAIKLAYSSESIGNFAGYSATVYFKDENTVGLDDKDKIFNIKTGDCAASTAKPLNIIGVDVGGKTETQTYQLGGIQFNPNTDLNPLGKIYVNDAAATATTVPTATALTAANLATYMGGFTKDKTTYGPLQDWDVRVVKDNKTGKINEVYVNKLITKAKVTTLKEGVIGLDLVNFGAKNFASAGTAPNKTLVVVDEAVKVGDYVSVTGNRDFNGTTYTVSPLLKNAGAKLTAIKDNGDVVFGDIVYSKNVTVAAAEPLFIADNLGKAFNVYLDATGRNYLYAELVDATVATSAYYFVKDVDTQTPITGKKYVLTVVNSKNETKTYALKAGTATGYLNVGGGVADWAATEDGTAANNAAALVYNEVNILKKVVKLTLNSDSEITKIEGLEVAVAGGGLGGVVPAALTTVAYDATFKKLSVTVPPAAASIVGTVDDDTVVYSYKAATKVLTVYTGKDLPAFSGATAAAYLVASLKVKAALFTDLGTAAASTNLTRGVITSYNTVAGSEAGKVKYVITCVAKGSLTAELTTAEEAVDGDMGKALKALTGYKGFVDFGLSADGDTVTSVVAANINAGVAINKNTSSWNTGIVTQTASGLYAIRGVVITADKKVAPASLLGVEDNYFTLATSADIYTINTTPANADVKPSTTASHYNLGSAANLEPMTVDVAYPIVFHTNDKNVIDTVFVYNYLITTIDMVNAAPAGLKATFTKATEITYTWTAVANVAYYTINYTKGGVAQPAEKLYTASKAITVAAGNVIDSFSVTATGGTTTTAAASLGSITTAVPAAPAAAPALDVTVTKVLKVTAAAPVALELASKYVISVTIDGVETLYDGTIASPYATTISNLTTGKVATVKYKAVNGVGESAWSATATATIS